MTQREVDKILRQVCSEVLEVLVEREGVRGGTIGFVLSANIQKTMPPYLVVVTGDTFGIRDDMEEGSP